MAAPVAESCAILDKEIDLFEDFDCFESEVEEDEAARDLEELMLDDELFIDLDLSVEGDGTQDSMINLPPVPGRSNVSDSVYERDQVQALVCNICKKTYKRKHFYEAHTAKCTTDKRQKLTTDKQRQKTDNSSSEHGE